MKEKRDRIPYLASLATAASLTGCSDGGGGIPDMEPVAKGLTFLGLSFVVGMLLLALRFGRKQ